MSRGGLFLTSGALAAAAAGSLYFGVTLPNKNIASFIAGHYHEYSRDANATRYECTGSPAQVADTLAGDQGPEARAASGATQYLRYSNNMVVVGPEGNRPCNVRVEPLGAGYNRGAYRFLGPGFTPGSPSRSTGGYSGGPRSGK
jgi:hypothetical protein